MKFVALRECTLAPYVNISVRYAQQPGLWSQLEQSRCEWCDANILLIWSVDVLAEGGAAAQYCSICN